MEAIERVKPILEVLEDEGADNEEEDDDTEAEDESDDSDEEDESDDDA
jgi:DNA gyrase subunit A